VSELIVVRHGETEWSRSGRHTGRTDVRLTARGEAQARLLGPLLGSRLVAHTLVSPAIRAWRTAQLAGLDGAATDPNLWEWDYGGYEGRTTAEIRLEAWLVSVDRRGDPRRRRASRRVGGGGGCSG
jgi:probable phosphoglycerate mutase